MEEKNKYPNDVATTLDCAIRDKEEKESGYLFKNVKYCNYMSNEVWNEFINNMSEKHKENFNDGNGGELNEGRYPPKMASFGSSSRLIYELSKDISDFSFEEKLDTRVGGVANIDGFLHRDNKYFYVEAKRREIYGSSHHNEQISDVYTKVYDKINKKYPDFSYESRECEKIGYKKFTFKIKNEEVKYFDLKQLICHFLGITYDIIKHDIKTANIVFLYLLYNPHKDGIENILREKYKKYCDKVLERYDIVQEFINNNIAAFKEIFFAVLDYQVETKNKEKPKIEFEFKLVDQTDYEQTIQKQIEC